MRIMVPLDGSERAEFALGPAAEIARGMPMPACLVLLRAVEIPVAVFAGNEPYPVQVLNQTVEASNDYLREIELRPTLEHLAVESHVVTTSRTIETTIAEEARNLHVDLIVLTSHGRTGFMRAMLGSVAHELAAMSQVPTVILRVDGQAFAGAPRHKPFTILVPLDGSELAEQALPPATLLARALKGSIRLVQVIPSLSDEENDIHRTIASADEYLTVIRARLERQGVPTAQSITYGAPAERIEQVALEHDCDMVALATHGGSGLERMLAGSVADHIVRHSTMPLLIVHPKLEQAAHQAGIDSERT